MDRAALDEAIARALATALIAEVRAEDAAHREDVPEDASQTDLPRAG